MRRKSTLVVAALLVVSAVAVVPAATAAQETTTTADGSTETETNETDANASLALGARLDAIVGIQQTELESEVEGRAFGLAIAAAANESEKASVVAARYGDLDQRLNELRQRKQELRRARQNGSLSEAQFRAEMAELHARVQSVQQIANRTENVSRGLPEEVLESKGINVTAIQRLKNNASELTGPEVADIARSIAGPSTGLSARAGPAKGAGPNLGNETDGRPEGVPTGGDRTPGGPAERTPSGNRTAEQRNETTSTDTGTGPATTDRNPGDNRAGSESRSGRSGA
ncbi:MAG: hypothetical protein ABEK02_09655 [Haloquadratum sp.]